GNHPSQVTRGLDHASRVYPACSLKTPKSSKPEFGGPSFREKGMDCRVKPGNDGCGPSPSGTTSAIFSFEIRRGHAARRHEPPGPTTERGMAEPGKVPRDDPHVPPRPQPGGIAARARAAAGAPYLADLNPEHRLT